MKTVDVSEATLPLADYTKEITKEPLIVTDKGKPVAALVSIRSADAETVSLSNNQEFLDLIERSRTRQKSEGGFSTEEVRRRLKLKKKEASTRLR
jgi:antitoxin (DNA-binding transcriptional repressor) of toxin-antitoxin stability system